MINLFKTLSDFRNPLAVACNILLFLVCASLCRLIYLIENLDAFASLTPGHAAELFTGGIRFDLSAMVYICGLYILLSLLPLHQKEHSKCYYQVIKWVYMIPVGLFVVTNLMDAVYFQYTNRRTTAGIFQEFSHEGNLGGIIGVELLSHWYLLLAAVVLIYAMWKLYRSPQAIAAAEHRAGYYATQVLSLAVLAGLSVGCARGGFAHSTRPITISNANEYADNPMETAIVLNTPFSIVRTMDKKAFVNPDYYPNREALEAHFNPVHRAMASDSVPFVPKNVVVFILESFSQEFLDRGLAPFIDSLSHESLSFDIAIANGRKSIDGMPSVLSSIPMFVEPFFLTSASLNRVGGLAYELNRKGYETAFFHGAPNGSMGFEAFANATGFKHYVGMTEYVADPLTDGKADFDGMWAIWDEEFFQFFGRELGKFSQPFATALFSASSHHPFAIPERYQAVFPEERIPLFKCIRYTDHALRRFFDYAKRQSWYSNTLFVVTADHTGQTDGGIYATNLGRFRIPLFFFAPDGSLHRRSPHIAQQIDIMPTVLALLGYDHDYIAFGKDLTHTTDSTAYAINYLNGIYQYLDNELMLQYDGREAKALYRYRTDSLLEHNVIGQESRQVEMELKLKAIIQQYMERMNADEILLSAEN